MVVALTANLECSLGERMDVRVRVLGEFEVEGCASHQLGSRKARTLLKLLALARGRPVAVDRLIECLWPDDEAAPSRPDEQVAVLVSRLRAVLGPGRLERTNAGYILVCDWLDLRTLEELAAAAARRLSAGSYALARAAAEAGLALARGQLLADEPEASWVTGERAAAERLIAELRITNARAALQARDYTAAANLAASIVERDTYDEAALRLLMEAHASAGRSALAVAAYGRVRERLSEELGIDPAPETEAIYLRILRQEPVSSTSNAPPGAARPAESAGSVLPGREQELAVLDAALERVAAGRVELVVVEGEAGIGKSRLLQTWADDADATGARVLRVRCDELERTLSLQPLADALDAYLYALPTREAVEAALGPEHALLAPLLRSAPTAAQLAAVDPVGGQAALFAALLAVFERLAEPAPMVLVLDDLHLADRATLAWLHFAVRRSTSARLLLLGAVRPEESVPLPQARRLVLGPLDLAAATRVVGKQRAAELHARSGGHPLFLIELAAVEASALPASLREAIAVRCERAGPEAAATLRTAALLSSAVDLDLLSTILKRPPLELMGHLEEGVQRGLLEERSSTFGFRHELVREALAARIGPARRLVIHSEAARALAARPGAGPLDVAYHARLGNDLELAASAYTRAAAQATERYDHVESERLLNLAVELVDTAPRRLRRARTRLLRADYAGAEADALRAFDTGAGASALETAGWAAYYRRDLQAAQRYADAGTRLGEGAVKASCLALGGRARHSNGELVDAEARLQQALALTDEPTTAIAPAVYLGFLRSHQGRAREALRLVAPALQGLHAPDLQMVTITAHMTTVHALGTLGEAAQCLQAIQVWEAEMERQGASRFKGRPANYRAWVLRGLGEFEQADELNWRARDEARELGTAEAEAHALLDLADGKLRVDELDAAASLLDAAAPLQELRHANRWRHLLRYRLLRGRLALAKESLEEAQMTACQLRDEANQMGVIRYADLGFLLEVRVAVALDEPVDHEAVATVLRRLPAHAGLESWWLAAETAAATRTDQFRALAETYADRLAAGAGEHAERFRAYAGARLESMRTVGLQG
jgi:DNA-binding SARP family transcriptional activator